MSKLENNSSSFKKTKEVDKNLTPDAKHRYCEGYRLLVSRHKEFS